ncbi:MAG: helix-turn-helix domain-containing protein [Lachnospiraceae bacterium]|nr:helix-turn-helix domain-containing protein [Lachnospiraceae bacterium]
MKIPLSVILYRLPGAENYLAVNADLSALYEGIKLFDADNFSSNTSDSLYLITESMLQSRSVSFLCEQLLSDAVFICLCKERTEALSSSYQGLSLVCLYTDHSFSRVFNDILGIFHSFDSWDKAFHLSLLQNCSLQELMNISREILTHPLVVLDNSYTVLGYVRKPGEEDPLMERLIEVGYATPELLSFLKTMGIISPLENSANPLTNRYELPDGRTVYSMMYRYTADKSTVGYSLSFCCPEHPDRGYLHLMDTFNENLNLFFHQAPFTSQISSDSCEAFLVYLMEHPKLSAEKLKSRLLAIPGLSLNGSYLLAQIRFSEETHASWSFIWWNLKNRLPRFRPFLYQEILYLLKDNSAAANPAIFLSDDEKNAFYESFSGYPLQCAVSQVFFSLTEMSAAVNQCREAMNLGIQLDNKISRRFKASLSPAAISVYTDILRKYTGITQERLQKKQRFYHYEDMALFHLLKHLKQTLPKEMYASPGYRILKQYDTDHHSSFCEVFAQYLINDRNINKTAAAVYLHRNTVLNKIKKAASIMGGELDDYPAQLFFILSWLDSLIF